jgi:prepilin-type N-terminal cleavage/methylation domain-containing protein
MPMNKSLTAAPVKGFTLLELMLVVLIIGILANISLPTFQNEVEQSRFTELLLKIDELRTKLEVANQADGMLVFNNDSALNLTSGTPQHSSSSSLFKLGIPANFSYPNLVFMIAPQKNTRNQITGLGLTVIGITGNAKQSLMNLSEVLPAGSWSWTARGKMLAIHLIDKPQ